MTFSIQNIDCYSSVTEFEGNGNITWLYKKSLLYDWLNQQMKIGKDINAKLHKGMHAPQCGNFMIFLSLKYFVKPILESLDVQNLPF